MKTKYKILALQILIGMMCTTISAQEILNITKFSTYGPEGLQLQRDIHLMDGVFTIAPPPPIDTELTPEFLPPLTYTPNDDDDCFTCIKNEVTTLINQIINNSGDNLYTYLPELDQNPLANSIPNEQLDDAIHRGIYLAMNTQNVIFGEEILIPIKKWYFQIRCIRSVCYF